MAFSVKKPPNSIDKMFDKPVNKSEVPIPTNNQLLQSNNALDDNLLHSDNDNEDIAIMHDKEPFIHGNTPYFYLNDNILSQTFGDFMNVDKQYNIKICIYKINGDCDIPFLQFLFDRSGEKATFPSIDFHCPLVASSGTDSNTLSGQDSVSQEHTFFMNQCSQELLKVLPIHDIFSEDILKQIYKGFIEYDNTLYVIFDSTKIDAEVIDKNEEKYGWVIIDEIANSRKILDKEIDTEIIDMFMKTPYMMHILDNHGHRIQQPILLYMCSKLPDATLYTNIIESDNTNSINIIDEPIDHPIFGSYYYFTSTPLSSTDIKRVKQYACFTFDCKYILTDINTIQEKLELIENLDNDDSNQSIYFKEDGIQLWCIKTSEQFTDI